MKIFYAVQATGNGHISRAMEILPYLQKYGEVDILLSGNNATLPVDLPVKYRSKGMSLHYSCKGTLNYYKTISLTSYFQVLKDAKNLPVEQYDLVLNDFDHVTSLACSIKNKSSINFGHQASFMSPNTPRPVKINKTGEWILKKYAKATHYIGLHFDRYDDFILPPVIKEKIWNAQPSDQGYITVYLPSYCDKDLEKIFSHFHEVRFQVFSRQSSFSRSLKNLTFIPVNNLLFTESLIHCHAIITGAGFETPSEAMFLNKKLMTIPIQGQYEQKCNAEALKKLGVMTLDKIDTSFPEHFNKWLQNSNPIALAYQKPTAETIEEMMEKALAIGN
jgi:uncharacterized protein (TIGR00661 family)